MEQKCAGDAAGAISFHVSTLGIDKSIFRRPEDFRQALNIIAVCSVKYGVNIYAYCLMSNHIHISGSTASELILNKFINAVKQNYSRYFKSAYGDNNIFRKVKVSINLLKTKQDLRNCIAYILRNPVEAKICLNADQYPWSSYACYFKNQISDQIIAWQFGKTALKEKLRTHVNMMATKVRISEAGDIIPESFVDVETVEELFGNSRDELAKYIAVNPYLALEFEFANSRKIVLNHYEFVKVASELAKERFDKKLSLLNMNERVSMVLTLYSDYNASPYQICQVLSLSKKSVYPILGIPVEK